VELFYEAPKPARGADGTARVASSAKVGEGASIGAYVVIEDDVHIGKNCTIQPFVHICRVARIGDKFKAYANVTVRDFCVLGDRVIATAQTGIPNSIEPDKVVSGYPAIDNKLWLKSSAVFKRLPELLKRVEALEKGVSPQRREDTKARD